MPYLGSINLSETQMEMRIALKTRLIGVAVFSTYVELSQGICHVLHLVPNIRLT